jgi:predicted patatin/cPLA2 family phospholipase
MAGNVLYKSPMGMIPAGLVMAGGGLRGIYTAGVLDIFLDAGVSFPYIIGVSAGAGFGSSFVSKQRGRNLEVLKKYRRDPRYISIRSFITTGNFFGLDFIYDDISLRLVPFDYETFMANPCRFVTVCIDCETGAAVYYDKSIEFSQGEFFTILKGTSALPYVARMVGFQGRKLLDGAIVDAIPLIKAQTEGYDYNVVVLTQPAGYRKREEWHPPANLFYGKYPHLIEAMDRWVATYNESMTYLEEEERQGRCLVLRPSVDLGVTRAEKSMEKLNRLYELGIADGTQALKRLEKLQKNG